MKKSGATLKEPALKYEGAKFDYSALPLTFGDVDGFNTLGGKGFIFFDAKCELGQVNPRQLIHFERLIDSLDKPAIYIIFEHPDLRPLKTFDIARAKVLKYYFGGRWYQSALDLGNLIEVFNNKLWLKQEKAPV